MFAYTYIPVVITPPRNQDAWIVALVSAAYSLLFSLPVMYLIFRFKKADYDRILETVLGKAIGKIFLILFFLFFFYCATACVILGDVFINTYLFPETPSWLLRLFTLGPALYASRKGAGTVARLAFFACHISCSRSYCFFFSV